MTHKRIRAKRDQPLISVQLRAEAAGDVVHLAQRQPSPQNERQAGK
jgi:hypothetical protein